MTTVIAALQCVRNCLHYYYYYHYYTCTSEVFHDDAEEDVKVAHFLHVYDTCVNTAQTFYSHRPLVWPLFSKELNLIVGIFCFKLVKT